MASTVRPEAVVVRAVDDPDGVEALVPLLLLAEPSERALRWSLAHLSDAVYRLDVDVDGAPAGPPAAAATIRWEGEPCEIVELAVGQARKLGHRLAVAGVGAHLGEDPGNEHKEVPCWADRSQRGTG